MGANIGRIIDSQESEDASFGDIKELSKLLGYHSVANVVTVDGAVEYLCNIFAEVDQFHRLCIEEIHLLH